MFPTVTSLMLMLAQTAETTCQAALKPLEFPWIEGYGGVVSLPDGPYQPRKGTKVVFELTAGAKPDGLDKGLERAARFVNLMALGGLKSEDYKVSVVLHGEATQAALDDAGYSKRKLGDTNPNVPLMKLLKEAGVEVTVFGQAVGIRQYSGNDGDRSSRRGICRYRCVVNSVFGGG